MEETFTAIKNLGYLEIEMIEGNEFYRFTSSGKFKFSSTTIAELKTGFKSDKKTGGILWALPKIITGNSVYIIHRVSFIRNVAEVNPIADQSNTSNTYLPDYKELQQTLSHVFSQGYLPVKFMLQSENAFNHSDSITNPELKHKNTAQHNQKSLQYYCIGTNKLIIPHAIISGNNTSITHIAMDVCNGTKAEIQFYDHHTPLNDVTYHNTSDLFSSFPISENQQIHTLHSTDKIPDQDVNFENRYQDLLERLNM